MTLYEGAIYMVQAEPLAGRAARLDGTQGLRHEDPRRLLHRRDRLHAAQDPRPLRRQRAGAQRASPRTARCTWCGASRATRRSATTPTRTSATATVNLPDQEMHTTAVWWQADPHALLAAVRQPLAGARRLPRRRLRDAHVAALADDVRAAGPGPRGGRRTTARGSRPRHRRPRPAALSFDGAAGGRRAGG